MSAVNPFEITKAVDFTDDEIRATFVDYPLGGFDSFASPASPVSKYLVGGKGGGRTHLMRHYSYALRKPSEASVLEQVSDDRYLGIYFRCSGLNSNRFRGKKISAGAWSDAFNFYLDVWLTEHLLNILVDINTTDQAWDLDVQQSFVRAIVSELHLSASITEGIAASASIDELRNALATFRKMMDRSINNAAIRGSLDIEIISNPGALIFATTAAARSELVGLGGVLFSFLIDEFENLTADQQMYVNTLLREKNLPTSFLIGSRRWGVKTHRTYSANEENKKGSEYEWVELEGSYRDAGKFDQFCLDLALRRLAQAGVRHLESADDLRQVFSSRDAILTDRLGDELALRLLDGIAPQRRPHMRRLHVNVLRSTRSTEVANLIFDSISRPDSPMSEKLSIHKFYQAWSGGRGPSLDAAQEAAAEIDDLRNGAESTALDNFLNLWKNDLLAQVYLDSDRRSPYLGIDKFIEMAGYLPRSFLMTMKYVTRAALVRGESPFDSEHEISSNAQMAGVLEASQWFLRDARPTQGLGAECERAIRRLGTLFNRVRYSDKPVEVSCVAFSTDFYGISPKAREVVEACSSHSMLSEIVAGRKTRNQGSVWFKYQLHPMLAPIFALPTGRRGELRLTSEEMTAIFDPETSEEKYSSVMRRKLTSMYAPFSDQVVHDPDQGGLF